MRMGWLLGLALMGIMLVGCRPEQAETDNPTPAANTNARPLEYGTVISGCKGTDLENWYESASLNLQTYRSELPNALIQPADVNIISRLTELGDAAISQPVPECAADLQNLAMSLVVPINEQYLAYYEGKIDQATLQANVNPLIQRYDVEVQPLLDSTRDQLNARLQGE